MTHHQRLDTTPLRRTEPPPLPLRRLARGTIGITPRGRGSHRVLLGICDEYLRSRTYSLMTREGFQVDSSENGDDLRQHMGDAILQLTGCARPKLIIADSMLEGCRGTDLLQALKDLHWQTSLILLHNGVATAYREAAAPLTLGPVDAEYLCEFSERLLESLEPPSRPSSAISHRRWFSVSDALRTISLYSIAALEGTEVRAL